MSLPVDPSLIAQGVELLVDLIVKLKNAREAADIEAVLPKIRALHEDLVAAPAVEKADHDAQIAAAVAGLPESP